MELLIKICDILACVTTVSGLLLVTRHYKWWILYTSSNLFYLVVTLHSKLPGLTLLGVILFFVGIKNYFTEKKKFERSNQNGILNS